MRRGWVVLVATTFALAAMLAFDQHQFGTPFAMYDAKAKKHFSPTGAGFGGAAATTSTPQATPTTSDQAVPATTQNAAPTATQQAAPPPTIKRAVGVSFSNPYGNVQVKVTINGGSITRVAAVDLPYGDPTSQSISDQVAPMLAQQAIDAQSANISGVSGATYTSDAYRQSLQSALDKLNFGK